MNSPFLVLLGWLLLAGSSPVRAQKPPVLQHITFKDKVLERNLTDYANQTRAKVISVVMEKRGAMYLYKLETVAFFEEVKQHPTSAWGKWRNAILLFRSTSADTVIRISDTTTFTNLQRYVRLFLPDQFLPVYENGKKVGNRVQTAHGLVWWFNIENGRLVSLCTNDGYNSEDFPEPK